MVQLHNGKRNIVLIGFMGCGKSTVGRQLAMRIGFDFKDSDHIIEAEVGMSVADYFVLHGAPAFREIESRVILDICSGENQVISTGGGSILSVENRKAQSDSNVVIWMTARPDVIVARTSRRKGTRPLLMGIENPLEHILKILAVRAPLYKEISNRICDTSDRPVYRAVSDIIRACVKRDVKANEPQ